MLELPVGGTAVGSGINTHPEFGRRVSGSAGRRNRHLLSSKRRITSRPTPSATGWSNATASCGPSPMTLFNVANNIRWLGSGPRCGFFEVQLPSRQPGSSIMPGKVNPVMCESLMQVAARVMGNDQTIVIERRRRRSVPAEHHDARHGARHAGEHSAAGQRDAGLCRFLRRRDGGQSREACEAAVEKSLSMVTSLNPLIGYEEGGGPGQGGLRHRQDDPGALPREGDPAGSNVARGAGSLADDGTAGVVGPPGPRLIRVRNRRLLR